MHFEKTFKITSEESLIVEKYFFELESIKNLLSVVVREAKESSCNSLDDVIEKISKQYRIAFIKLSTVQNEIISKRIDRYKYDNIKFSFNFNTQEVSVEYDIKNS